MKVALQEETVRAEGWERQLPRALEQTLGRLDETIHTRGSERGTALQQIATQQARQTHAWSQSADLEQDLEQTRKQLSEPTAGWAGWGSRRQRRPRPWLKRRVSSRPSSRRHRG